MDTGKTHRIFQNSKASYKITHRMTVGHVDQKYGGESLCLRFDPEDKYIAGGFSDHSIKIFNSLSGKAAFSLHFTGISDHEKMPITCIRWRPQSSGLKTQNILVATCANATIQHWHVTSGKCLHVIKVDPEHHLYCLDYHPGGTQFAVSGKQRKVDVYDETTKSLLVSMDRGDHGNPGHSNRVYCVKYNLENPKIIISGGWDQTMQVWDTRIGESVASIYGPYICGDSIDIDSKGVVLTGSYRPHESLQLWDLGTRKVIQKIEYQSSKTALDSGFIYGAQFSKPNQNLIVAGGGGKNQVKVFDRKSQNRLIGAITDMPKPAMGINYKNKGNGFAIAGGDGQLRLINIDESY